MRLLLQKILRPFFFWVAAKFSAAPRRDAVFKSLSGLYRIITTKKTGRGVVIDFDLDNSKFIIFSDQHKGANDSGNDFANNEVNYIVALEHYYKQGFTFINLGDAEELWKYDALKVIANNEKSLAVEAKFHEAKRYYRTFGNHDLQWKNMADVFLYLRKIFTLPMPVYEGIVLKASLNNQQQSINIFLTHGHQGDTMSDNNAFSSWVIAHIWAPLQRFLAININTPANDPNLLDKHNRMMYEWSSRKDNLILITGHTHKPVFASGKYTKNESHKIDTTDTIQNVKPGYFNTGCCCFNDGDITGIEICDGNIRLIKWHNDDNVSSRIILEEKNIKRLIVDL